jgi:phosphoserine phosphatase RsbU/P
MPEDRTPSSYRYQQALAPLARQLQEPELKRRLSEVLTLLDFNSTLNRSLELSEILDLVLFVALGEMRASWAGILLRSDDRIVPAARRGRPDGEWSGLSFAVPDEVTEEWENEIRAGTRATIVAPLAKSDRLVGVLLLGDREESYGEEEKEFAEALCVSAAASIDNGRIYEELRELNRKLSLKVYQLNSLFDITRELNRSPDAGRVRDVLLTNALGQVLTTRAILIQDGAIVAERGVSLPLAERMALEARGKLFQDLAEERTVAEIENRDLREPLVRANIEIVVPLRSGTSSHGALLLGPRASGRPMSEEDRGFLRSLAAQTASALDNLRLTREWVEKQKIEKEMALAREIQRGLLPDGDPEIEGWDIDGINIPCLTVGGDYFDYLARGGGKYWLVIADVSGKGTGAALLMASAQAAIHALAGLGEISLQDLVERLNEVVYRSTEVNRYVTAFIGCLDTRTGEMEFVNAGHCYPMVVRAGGPIERLVEGGPVIGLLERPDVSPGRTRFEPGDLLLMYTDGLSETQSPDGEEFDEERIVDLLKSSKGLPSREILAKLLAGVRVFAAGAGLSDDLTLMVVQRT